jgi:hypothetical protein
MVKFQIGIFINPVLSDPELLTQFKVRVLDVLYAAGLVVRKVKVESGASSVSCLEE